MTLPKKEIKPGSVREKAIGLRLKEVREFLSYSLSQFAGLIGIKKERLASYESGRVPIPWEIALQICHQFFVSEHWLATGGGKAMGWPGKRLRFSNSIVRATLISHSNPILKSLPRGLAFSATYDLVLSKEYWQEAGRSARTFSSLDFSEADAPDRLRRDMDWRLAFWRSILPRESWGIYCTGLMNCGALLFDSLNMRNGGARQTPEKAESLMKWITEEMKKERLLP
jgi:DNA-binding XRE family transcriptional regulator